MQSKVTIKLPSQQHPDDVPKKFLLAISIA
jgi:hypothetical protein